MSPTAEERIDSFKSYGGQNQQLTTKLSKPLEKLSIESSNMYFDLQTKVSNSFEYVINDKRTPLTSKIEFSLSNVF